MKLEENNLKVLTGVFSLCLCVCVCRGAVHRWRDEEYVQQSAQADRVPGRVPGLPGLPGPERETPRPDRRCSPQGGAGGTRLRW